jgi:hypothetical protein
MYITKSNNRLLAQEHNLQLLEGRRKPSLCFSSNILSRDGMGVGT